MSKCDCKLCNLRGLFFVHATPEETRLICEQKTERIANKGSIIIKEGDPVNEFIYLKSGLIKLFRFGSDGKEQIITIAKPFDFISLLSVFSTNQYNYSVSALENSTICVLNFNIIKSLIQTNGPYALSLIEKLNSITDKIIIEGMEVRQRHLKGRVAYILIKFADEIYKNSEFELPMSRKEIAEYIGMTTENVIRTLSEFRKDKILKIYGKVIEIVDKNTLEKISKFG